MDGLWQLPCIESCEKLFPPFVPYTNASRLAPNDSGLIKYSQLCPLVSCYLVSYKNKKKIVCECRVWLNETRNIRQQSSSLVCHNTANIGKMKWAISVPYKAQLQTAKTNLSLLMSQRHMGKWNYSSTHSQLLHWIEASGSPLPTFKMSLVLTA